MTMRFLRAFFIIVFALTTAASAQQAGPVSQMPFASIPLDGTELFYIIQNGVSKKTTSSTFASPPFTSTGNGATASANDAVRWGDLLFDAVADGGADNTDTVDTTSKIQVGINAAARTGRTYFFPAGGYIITDNLVVPSGSNIQCAPGTILYEMHNESIFINTNAQTNWATNYTAANRTTATDHDITINNCEGNFTKASNVSGPFALGSGLVTFLLAQRIHITHNSAYGDTTGTNSYQIANLVRFQKIFDSNAAYNFANGVYNGVGIYGGSQNVSATWNTYTLAPNTTNANAFSCSNINGVGGATSAGPDNQTSSQLTYSYNTCYPQGGDNAHGGVVAYNNAAGSSGSQLNDFTFEGNRTYATGSKNFCFSANGNADGWHFLNNTFSGCDKGAIVFAARAVSWCVTPTNPCDSSPNNAFTTVNGSQLVTFTFTGVNTQTVSVGNYIAVNAASPIGNVTLLGYYPVTAVGSGFLTFDSGTVANSSATGGGLATVATVWGTPRNFDIEGNHLYNVNAYNAVDGLNDSGEFVVAGPNNVLKNNTVEGGAYGAITLTSNFDCCSSATPVAMVLSGNQGAAGIGVPNLTFGWTIAGDNLYAYQSTYPPLILDYAAITSTGTWTPNPLWGGANTNWTFSQTAHFTKNGSDVLACFNLIWSAKAGGFSTGAFTVTGLPFPVHNGFAYPFNPTIVKNTAAGDNTFTAQNILISTPGGSTATLVFYTDITHQTQLDDTNILANTSLSACGHYETP